LSLSLIAFLVDLYEMTKMDVYNLAENKISTINEQSKYQEKDETIRKKRIPLPFRK